MKIVLLGKDGQLGWELQRSLAPLGTIIALDRKTTPRADFTRPADVANTIRRLRPKLIVNAAAYTAVDRAETDTRNAMLVNAVTPAQLAEVAAETNAWLVHYSTDYVFDGSGHTAWTEWDACRPLNKYGFTKLVGEESIRATGCNHFIFRTSWLYGARGNNFIKSILALAQERDTLKVVNDQFGAPTSVEIISDITAHAVRAAMITPRLGGTYHVAQAGETTWFDYARHIIARARDAGLPITVADASIHAVSTSEFAALARRPANSRLNTEKLRRAFDLHLPHWQTCVDRTLAELLQE